MDQALTILNHLGTLAFALAGAMGGVRKELDLFGVLVTALLPAIGGGTIRDLILDVPVFWVVSTVPIWIALGAGLMAFLLARHVERRRVVLDWADAVGLGIFAVVGAERAFTVTGDPLVSVMMGVSTGVLGGLIRDVVTFEFPMIMSPRELYATAAFGGAGTTVLVLMFQPEMGPWALWLGVVVSFVMRAGGMVFGWTLPRAKFPDSRE
ncbi:trimeric intracellular cation channel family protein [Yunchengibacter salinarum]|uniref:trimeric intracellular cation channel family protein n=1 Tax=Yunchengibacter salinarum TaxID=3133399 RepID=UPI0035B66FA8